MLQERNAEAWCLLSVRSLISYHVSEGLDTLQLHFQPTGAGLEIAEGVFCGKCQLAGAFLAVQCTKGISFILRAISRYT